MIYKYWTQNAVVANMKNCPQICLGKLHKITKKKDQSRWPVLDRNSNPDLAENVTTLTVRLKCSVK